MNVLVIDNFDSFIYNYIDSLKVLGHQVVTLRNTATLEEVITVVTENDCHCIVISPGPGQPQDAGVCLDLIRYFAGRIPIIGICLGHQALANAFGGDVVQDAVPFHGKRSVIQFSAAHTLFKGINSSLSVGRYHSLKVSAVPENFTVIATAGETIMAMANDQLGLLGVQFHPESILTTHGERLIENSMDYAAQMYQQLQMEVCA